MSCREELAQAREHIATDAMARGMTVETMHQKAERALERRDASKLRGERMRFEDVARIWREAADMVAGAQPKEDAS